jgi:hypothetical protein
MEKLMRQALRDALYTGYDARNDDGEILEGYIENESFKELANLDDNFTMEYNRLSVLLWLQGFVGAYISNELSRALEFTCPISSLAKHQPGINHRFHQLLPDLLRYLERDELPTIIVPPRRTCAVTLRKHPASGVRGA